MTNHSKDHFTELLAYQHRTTDDRFAEQVREKISRRYRLRRQILVLTGIVALVVTSLLLSISHTSAWEPIASYMVQSPMIVTAAIIAGLFVGLIIRTEDS